MKTYQIILLDSVTKELDKVENFKGSEEELKNRLLKLQEGFCEDEKPTISTQKFTDKKGRLIEALIAECEADFCYMAALRYIGKS